MDGKRFDQVTRSLASGGNRRGFLKGVAGALAGVAGFKAMDAAAGCRPGGWYCQRNSDCCSSACNVMSRGGRQRICCTADPVEVTCAGKSCGVAINNCGVEIECPDLCEPVDPCTPADCVSGVCNASSACTGVEICGGGGDTGQCGCTPNCTNAVFCGDPDGCGGICVGDFALGIPVVSLSFVDIGNSNFCGTSVTLSGFAGCTKYSALYRTFEGASLQIGPFNYGDPNLHTTNLTGGSVTGAASYVKDNASGNGGACVEIIVDGAYSSGCQRVIC